MRMSRKEQLRILKKFGNGITVIKTNTPYLSGYVIRKNNKTIGTWINGFINTRPFKNRKKKY